MKLTAELNDKSFEIEIRRDDGGVSAIVDGREYALEASRPEPNIYLLKLAGKIYEVFISPENAAGEPLLVKIGNHELPISISDPKKLRSSRVAVAASDGIVEIKTAMPGKLVRVLVAVGAEIAEGEAVLIVEAMKMQNEMRSPKAGIVKEIRFEEGATVNAGDVLAVIE